VAESVLAQGVVGKPGDGRLVFTELALHIRRLAVPGDGRQVSL
jgi:hypothetical protein